MAQGLTPTQITLLKCAAQVPDGTIFTGQAKHNDPTFAAYGTRATLRVLARRGLIRIIRTKGGWEAEITNAGRRAARSHTEREEAK